MDILVKLLLTYNLIAIYVAAWGLIPGMWVSTTNQPLKHPVSTPIICGALWPLFIPMLIWNTLRSR